MKEELFERLDMGKEYIAKEDVSGAILDYFFAHLDSSRLRREFDNIPTLKLIDIKAKMLEMEDKIEELNKKIEKLKDNNEWHDAKKEQPKDKGQEYIVCVTGMAGNIHYDNAVIAGDNYFENGKWFIQGVYRKSLNVLAWRYLPEYKEQDKNSMRLT